jgi:MSHA biogenesis protein MshK
MVDRMKNLFGTQRSRINVQGSTFKVQHGTRNPEPGILNSEHAAAAWVVGVVLALMPAIVLSQVMTDPTRPPTGYADTDVATAPAGPMLQSVMITPTAKAAIISGEMVKLGEKFGSAKLVKITESEVVLKDGDESQVLKLYPGVEMRAVEKPAAKSAAKRQKQR